MNDSSDVVRKHALYLRQRGIYDADLMERMRIGYAPGASLRAHLNGCGYRSSTLRGAGLIDSLGRDRLFRCITFPLEEAGSLYGRSIDDGIWRHRFLPRSKGGLYGWRRAQLFQSLILVEGLLDLAALWQAGFPQTVALLGSHASPAQMAQLQKRCGSRVHVCLDADVNGAGQTAARGLSARLRQTGVEVLALTYPLVTIPPACLPPVLLHRTSNVFWSGPGHDFSHRSACRTASQQLAFPNRR